MAYTVIHFQKILETSVLITQNKVKIIMLKNHIDTLTFIKAY